MKMTHDMTAARNDHAVRAAALKKLKALFPNGRPRFGDKRDAYVAARNTSEPLPNPCTSRNLSTMPTRQR